MQFVTHTYIYIYAAHDGVMIPETLIVDRLIELQYPWSMLNLFENDKKNRDKIKICIIYYTSYII